MAQAPCGRPLLWIDDEIDSDDSGVGLLRASGFDVSCAPTATAGLSALEAKRFSLVILDLRLPDMSGIDLLARTDSRSRPPTLVLSGYADMELAVTAMRLGASDVKRKPLYGDDLLSAIEACASESMSPLLDPDTPVDLFAEALAQFLAAATSREAAPLPPVSVSITRALEHMQEMVRAKQLPGICEAAAAYGGSAASFRRQLREETGAGFRRWRRLLRIRSGLARLGRSSERVQQIAFELGYDHSSQFDRDVHAELGMSPKQFRQRIDRNARHRAGSAVGSDH